jgi:hypothetical protein
MKPGSPKPFFIRAAKLLGQMDIDGRKVEKTLDYIRTPWYTDDGEKNMVWSLCKMRKGTPNEIFRAEFQELVNKKYNDHTRIYTDGSKKEEKVWYAVVTDQQSIFSVEQEAIIDAIQKLPKTGVRSVILTDSLNIMIAASGNNHTKTEDQKD